MVRRIVLVVARVMPPRFALVRELVLPSLHLDLRSSLTLVPHDKARLPA